MHAYIYAYMHAYIYMHICTHIYICIYYGRPAIWSGMQPIHGRQPKQYSNAPLPADSG